MGRGADKGRAQFHYPLLLPQASGSARRALMQNASRIWRPKMARTEWPTRRQTVISPQASHVAHLLLDAGRQLLLQYEAPSLLRVNSALTYARAQRERAHNISLFRQVEPTPFDKVKTASCGSQPQKMNSL